MTKTISLKAEEREEKNGRANKIRTGGLIPAVVYAPNMENITLKIKLADFMKAYHEAGESNLIDLAIGRDKAIKVIIKDVQTDSVKGMPIHADFYMVNMEKNITAEIPVVFTGEAPAVREFGGMLVKSKDAIEVECLPGDLPSEITVDISVLKELNSLIKVGDITPPKGVVWKGHPDDVLISVTAVTEEPEAKPEEAPAEGEAAKPEEAPAEGEAAKPEDKK